MDFCSYPPALLIDFYQHPPARRKTRRRTEAEEYGK